MILIIIIMIIHLFNTWLITDLLFYLNSRLHKRGGLRLSRPRRRALDNLARLTFRCRILMLRNLQLFVWNIGRFHFLSVWYNFTAATLVVQDLSEIWDLAFLIRKIWRTLLLLRRVTWHTNVVNCMAWELISYSTWLGALLLMIGLFMSLYII